MHSSIPSSLLNPAHSSCSPAVKVCAAALWLCGKSYFSLTCLPYSWDTNGLYPCTEFAKVLRPNWIFLDCLICAFTMVKTINRIAEKTGSTGFCSLDMMLAENALLFREQSCHVFIIVVVYWRTRRHNANSSIHSFFKLMTVEFVWTRSRWQMSTFCCCYVYTVCGSFFRGFYLLSSYICLFIHNEMHLLAFDQVWSITNMHCGDLIYLHMNGTTFRSIVNCTLWFLSSLLPVRISLIRRVLCPSLQFSFESQIAFGSYWNPNLYCSWRLFVS